MQPHSFSNPKASGNAFTLIELLVVVAIILIMTSLVVPAFNSLGKANLLTTSGNQIVNVVNYAREYSMSNNAMTALIMLSDPTQAGMNQTFTMFAMAPPANGAQSQTSDWKQISKWERLNAGVVSDQCTFQDSQAQQIQPPLPVLNYSGKTPADYKYVVFLPNGALLSGSAAQIRLCQGYFQTGSTTPVYTGKTMTPGTPANYYYITVLAATGRTKVDRP